jgi:transcriptional regulator GlxA family with amidase domain
MALTLTDRKIVAQAISLLEKDCKYHQSQAFLANHFNITEQKLRKIFKLVTGKTINQFAIDLRIEQAKELLLNTDDPIKLIAVKIGYDKRTFERRFKVSTGLTPLGWRIYNRSGIMTHIVKGSSEMPPN